MRASPIIAGGSDRRALRERLSVAEADLGAHFLPTPTKPYIGMTKEQVVACAGKPSGSYGTTAGETLTYHYSGAGPVPTATPAKSDEPKGPLGKPKSDKTWKCSASLSFEGGKLARVSFAPRDVVSPYEKKKDPKTGKKDDVDAAGALQLLAAELRALSAIGSFRHVADRLGIVAVGIEDEGPVIIGVIVRAVNPARHCPCRRP